MATSRRQAQDSRQTVGAAADDSDRRQAAGGVPAPRRRPGLAVARLALVIGSVVVLVGGAELVTRWIGPHLPFLMVPSPGNCLQRSRTRSVAFRPNCEGLLSETRFRTNALGFRGPQVRDDGSPRILALGDSSTWGWRVAESESYPGVLQELLDARAGGTRYQVINGGVPGYTSYQGLMTMQEVGVGLHPAVVIIGFGWNDAARSGDFLQQLERENRYLPLIRLDEWLLDSSRFYRWARTTAQRRAPSGARGAEAQPALKSRIPTMQGWGYLSRIAGLAGDAGGHVVFLNFLTPGTHTGRNQLLTGLAEQLNAPLIRYEGPRLDLVHPTAAGYRQLAEQISAALATIGALSDAPAAAPSGARAAP